MELQHDRAGTGPPLVLVHGLGGNRGSWRRVAAALAAHREVVALDLPGFGASAPLPGPPTVAALADALEAFVDRHGLRGAALVGSSLGARLVLELTRRGVPGPVVALDPGGFWTARERAYFRATLGTSIALVRRIAPALPALTSTAPGRAALLAQLSARPWALPRDLVLDELRSIATSPGTTTTYDELMAGPTQAGSATTPGPVTFGWGTRDLGTLPRQARTAQARFPAARLHWFAGSGHFPQWDVPDETTRLVLEAT